jgi:hypothetical protein
MKQRFAAQDASVFPAGINLPETCKFTFQDGRLRQISDEEICASRRAASAMMRF